MKFAIIGSALSGNKGAGAMLESSVQHLTAASPDAEFSLLSMYPIADRQLNPFPNVVVLDASPVRLGILINGTALLHRLAPPLRPFLERVVPEIGALAAADVLLDEGGITFVDGRGKFLIYNVASILPALLLRIPIVKVAQAMGPFERPVNRFIARLVLPRMTRIVSRGSITHEHLLGLGLQNVEEGADLAFTHIMSETDRTLARRSLDSAFFDAGGVVGFSPSAVLEKAARARGVDYLSQVARQVDHVTQVLDRRVLLLAHSARMDTDNTHNNDLPLCRAIKGRVGSPDRVLFVDDELSPGALRYLIGMCDVFVASRFHAMVSSLSCGVPTLVIGWSHKYREVLEMFGQENFAVAAEDCTDELFIELMDELIRQRASVHYAIVRASADVRQLAERQVRTILEVAASDAGGTS